MEKLSVCLPPGFGFHPTDAELISHYLKLKILGHNFDELIPEVDIYKHEPWDLPAKCRLRTRDSKWHFFALIDRKYPNSSRTNRATEEGYWKSTGKDRDVKSQNRVLGTKKTLVFHEGRPPCGRRTDWIMHEYHIGKKEYKAALNSKDIFVLCRVTKRNGWESEEGKVAQNAEPVVFKESSSHSTDIDDIDAWVAELFDPNFSGPSELEHEAEGDLTSVPTKQEPLDTYLDPNSEENVDFLLVDDIFDILRSGCSDNINLADSKIGTENTVKQDSSLRGATASNSCESPRIQIRPRNEMIRQRNEDYSAGVPSDRIRLQVSKMQSTNTQSVNLTVKYSNKDYHRDLSRSYNKGFAGLNWFIFGACLAGSIALIMYFLFPDARWFLTSSSKPHL
ncbi:NAC domain-containing protein 74-like isoform X1 [Zingiber officinale]|nr:NAC domain-containing protein 74-like isoform X1 [Zingiber officinale]